MQLFWYKYVRQDSPKPFKPRKKMPLADRIREARVKKGMSLQQVADKVGGSKAHIWDLETGRAKNPSIDLLKKLADCFGTSVTALVGENPETEEDDSRVLGMYRELKELTEADLKVIQSMVEALKKK
jgi:transcriptional regulator with XRE-family HTH domain